MNDRAAKPHYSRPRTHPAPGNVQDNSTYKDPHHYSTGIPYVLVNGIPVLMNGEHTGAKAGQALWNIAAPRGGN